ncbi:MAG: MarR family transcriptional regulator [bacterium]
MSDRELSEAERTVYEGLRRTAALFARELSAALEHDVRLTAVEFELLETLATPEAERLRMSDLAERIMLTPSGVTRVVTRLGRRGLLVRHRTDGGDGRAYVATITEAGRELLARAGSAHRSAVRRVVRANFSEAETAALAALLTDRIPRLPELR